MRLEDEIKQEKFKSEHQKLIINILFSYSWLNAKNVKRLQPFGISWQQFNVLRILRGQYPKSITNKSITERMLDKTSNATRLVDKLILKGLASREPNASDRRAVDVVITEEGLKLLEKIDKVELEWIEDLNQLTVEEAKELNRLLDKMRS